jgi:hypothetical protein
MKKHKVSIFIKVLKYPSGFWTTKWNLHETSIYPDQNPKSKDQKQKEISIKCETLKEERKKEVTWEREREIKMKLW